MASSTGCCSSHSRQLAVQWQSLPVQLRNAGYFRPDLELTPAGW